MPVTTELLWYSQTWRIYRGTAGLFVMLAGRARGVPAWVALTPEHPSWARVPKTVRASFEGYAASPRQ